MGTLLLREPLIGMMLMMLIGIILTKSIPPCLLRGKKMGKEGGGWEWENKEIEEVGIAFFFFFISTFEIHLPFSLFFSPF